MLQITVFESIENPRTDMSPTWKLWCVEHRDYTLGDEIYPDFEDLTENMLDFYGVKDLEELLTKKEVFFITMVDHSSIVLKYQKVTNLENLKMDRWDESLMGFAVSDKGTSEDTLQYELDLYKGYIDGYCGNVYFFADAKLRDSENFSSNIPYEESDYSSNFWGSEHLARIVECAEEQFETVDEEIEKNLW